MNPGNGLIKHFWVNNRDVVVKHSVRNCHVRGVDSIMLLNAPGMRIRLFVARPEHELGHNMPYQQTHKPLSVGYHPHHCDITLQVVRGWIMNRLFKPLLFNQAVPKVTVLSSFVYHSKLLGQKPGFQGTVFGVTHSDYDTIVNVGESLELDARDCHTIGAKVGSTPAWLVYEGEEAANYQPICYSDDDLTKFNFDDMYTPMSEWDIHEILRPLIDG